MGEAPACPQCGSNAVWKDGLRYLSNNEVCQRYLCKVCGFRFSESKVSKRNQPYFNVDAHQKAVKLLVEAQRQIEKREAGATLESNVKSEILKFAWWMKKEGYAENTITRRVKLLSTLAKRGASLLEPETVKEAIARQNWSLKTKELAAEAYTCFLKMHGGTWTPPIYKPPKKLPFIPTEAELDSLISGCNRKTACFLMLLKETAARLGEAWMLEWKDIDFDNRLVKITPEKGGEPRAVKVSEKLLSMLNALPKNDRKVFAGSMRHFARSFRRQRRKVACKLQNSRINLITFHTFRHWKATMEYYKTKDILHVMRLLGHRNINNTLLYTQLVNFESHEYHSAAARTAEEARKLVEAGFEYVCTTPENVMVFRKRK